MQKKPTSGADNLKQKNIISGTSLLLNRLSAICSALLLFLLFFALHCATVVATLDIVI